MDPVGEYLLFVAKVTTLALVFLALIAVIVAAAGRGMPPPRDRLKVKHLNRHYEQLAHVLRAAMLPRKELRSLLKRRRAERHHPAKKNNTFVLNFDGDIRASAIASLREEITAVLTVAAPEDEVLVRLESRGGLVHAYGLAASQLLRIKEHGIRLVAAVDKVAASGGYMMACVADRIIAAPFAVVGSIGVVSQLPNFHRYLKKNDIDFEQFTAGEFKRTVTLFGENTAKDRAKFQQDIDEAHQLFKDFVRRHRPTLDIDATATGEHWYGTRALELKLVDDLQTSDQYLLQASEQTALYEVSWLRRKSLGVALLGRAATLFGVRSEPPLP